jgi:hypothetical protein
MIKALKGLGGLLDRGRGSSAPVPAAANPPPPEPAAELSEGSCLYTDPAWVDLLSPEKCFELACTTALIACKPGDPLVRKPPRPMPGSKLLP